MPSGLQPLRYNPGRVPHQCRIKCATAPATEVAGGVTCMLLLPALMKKGDAAELIAK